MQPSSMQNLSVLVMHISNTYFLFGFIFTLNYICLFQNYLQEIKHLAKFLNIEPSEELIEAIAGKCRFDKMVVDKEYTKEKRQEEYKGSYTMYRKGMSNLINQFYQSMIIGFKII